MLQVFTRKGVREESGLNCSCFAYYMVVHGKKEAESSRNFKTVCIKDSLTEASMWSSMV